MDPENSERLQWIFERRHASPAAFDATWHVSEHELAQLVVAARCAGLVPGEPAVQLVVIDDPEVLDQIATLGCAIGGAPMVIAVLAELAPATGQALDGVGALVLGAVLENMWLAAQAAHLEIEVLTDLDREPVRQLLAVPGAWRVAYAIRVGHLARGEHPALPGHAEAITVHHNRVEVAS